MALGQSLLHTFPFWIYVDTRNPPSVGEIELDDCKFRFYPPFRSAEAGWMPNPKVNPRAIPFVPGVTPEISEAFRILSLSAVLNIEGKGLRLNWGEGWGDPPLVEMPMDSLRLDYYGPSKAGERAHVVTRMLLAHLRWKSRQCWILQAMDGLFGTVRNAMGVDERGSPTQQPYGSLTVNFYPWKEKSVDNSIWTDALDAVRRREQPGLEAQLFLDGRYFRLAQDYRRMVLDLATACEFAKDRAVERIWRARTKAPFRRGRVLTGYDLSQHVSTSLDAFCQRNFASEYPNDFVLIEKLWAARGTIAHGGQLQITKRIDPWDHPTMKHKETSLLYDVSIDDYFEAAETLIAWLNGLSK